MPAFGPMWKSSRDLGHSEDPEHSLSLALELSRALCMELNAKVSFSEHVCSFPGLTKTPQHLGKAEEGGRRHPRHNQWLINILIAAQLPWRIGLDTHIQSGKED